MVKFSWSKNTYCPLSLSLTYAHCSILKNQKRLHPSKNPQSGIFGHNKWWFSRILLGSSNGLILIHATIKNLCTHASRLQCSTAILPLCWMLARVFVCKHTQWGWTQKKTHTHAQRTTSCWFYFILFAVHCLMHMHTQDGCMNLAMHVSKYSCIE